MTYEQVQKGTQYQSVLCGDQVQIRTPPYKGVRIGTPRLFAETIDGTISDDLLTAAMRACGVHDDSPEARDEMCAACVATPDHLRADLLAHFRTAYPSD